MKKITKEEFFEGVLIVFESVALGSSILIAVAGAVLGTLADLIISGVKYIDHKCLGKGEYKADFKISDLKIRYLYMVNSFKGVFTNLLIVKGDGWQPPTKESDVRPLFQKMPPPATGSSSESEKLSEDELEELDDAFKKTPNPEETTEKGRESA